MQAEQGTTWADPSRVVARSCAIGERGGRATRAAGARTEACWVLPSAARRGLGRGAVRWTRRAGCELAARYDGCAGEGAGGRKPCQRAGVGLRQWAQVVDGESVAAFAERAGTLQHRRPGPRWTATREGSARRSAAATTTTTKTLARSPGPHAGHGTGPGDDTRRPRG